ncbi:MAG: trehalose-phosphatase [Bryobacterales bacterium]|nr:trehalose-phosphatase [Bryobacterales bacterium]
MNSVRTRAFFEHTAELEAALTAAPRVLACFDFDGTLAPIVERPEAAWMPAETHEALGTLARAPGVTLALISGRALGDLRARAALDGVVYAGNHGLEIEGAGWRYLSPAAEQARSALESVNTLLLSRLEGMPGVLVEPKGLTTSIHFRLASRADASLVPEIVAGMIAPYGDRFRLTSGKEVVEVRPEADWHKGKAILWLSGRLGDPMVLFAGDDVTDEDAFAALPDGVTVKVGPPGDTLARYRVDGPADVTRLIAWLDRLRRQRS